MPTPVNKSYHFSDEETEIQFQFKDLRKIVLDLRALNHELRQKIVQLLLVNGPMTVTQLYVKLRIEQSVASQHLAILRKANIVVAEREGKFIHYHIHQEQLEAVKALLLGLQ